MKNSPIILLIAILLSGYAHTEESTEYDYSKYKSTELFHKLRSNEPNYFVAAFDEDDNEEHFEFNISIKYPLLDKDTGWWRNAVNENDELLFIYNGTYDFYFGSRDSAPVISRRQNPGMAYHHYFSNPNNSIRLGWYHESNGQTIENIQQYRLARYAEDKVSRGWDYFGINIYSHPQDWNLEADLRLYCNCQGLGSDDKEDELFWDPTAKPVEIADYDGLRFKIEPPANLLPRALGQLRVELKTGSNDLHAAGYLSGKITLFNLFNGSPFTAFYFNGYGKELSSYHLRNEYYGIGFEFR